MKSQETWTHTNPFRRHTEQEIRELSKAVDALVAAIEKDYDQHGGIINEALSYFFTEEFTALEVRTIHNELRK
jgi:hypothetical protein